VEKISTPLKLFAPDDLADPRVIQAHQLADFTERESGFLGSGKCLAPRLPCRLIVALELFLSRLNRVAGNF
jgi:hypothetical protein